MSSFDLIAALGVGVAASGLFYNVGVGQGRNLAKEDLSEKKKLQSVVSSLQKQLDDEKLKMSHLEQGLYRPVDPNVSSKLLQILSTEDKDAWLAFAPDKPERHDQIVQDARLKVIAIANLKGGVAKTTTASNLAAYFDHVCNKNVLVIDADYQGSLSVILRSVGKMDNAPTKTGAWLQHRSGATYHQPNLVGGPLPRTKFLSAFYELQNLETRLQIEWLLSRADGQSSADLRYRFAEVFRTPSFLAERYDVVIIDCPPRLSTATINALACATHLLIPTVPDIASLEAASNFIAMARVLTSQINPCIRLAGVAPMLTMNANLTPEESKRIDDFRLNAHQFGDKPYVFKNNVPRSKPVSDVAGTGIALLNAPSAQKKIFKLFGDEVWDRVSMAQQVTV